MFHRYVKRLVPALCFFTLNAAAQNSNKENAPYSRYGIGELRSGNNILLRGMGDASTAWSSGSALNTDNPASYAVLKITTYEAGLEASYRNIKAGTSNYNTGTLTLAYLNIGIPLGKHFGMAAGLRPQSRIYYNIADSGTTAGIGNTVTQYRGDGGLNFAYLGVGAKYGGFSLGVNAGYSFGNINTNSLLNNIDTTAAVNSEFSRSTRVGGIYWKAGVQYETMLQPHLKLRLGSTLELSQSLNATRDNYTVEFHYASGSRLEDTAYSTTGASGSITLPMTYRFGVLLGGNKWTASLDYQNTNWSQFRNFGMTDSLTDHAMRISGGMEYTPNETNIYKYLQRVTYRIGFYYGRDIVMLRNTDMNYYALTFGASLPFRRSIDRIHTMFEIGSRGTQTNNLVRENFIRFGLGVSLNAIADRWFVKRRYD